MEKTIALASVYELQGLKSQALEIYKNVLEKDPRNKEALQGCKRLTQTPTTPCTPRAQLQQYAPLQRFEMQKMQKLFIQAEQPAQLRAIEQWLMQWN
ncbi:hypothetical protein [Helicobacter vulpis]|uniref:hypothetical protein n=1 Tax=Helicobacter vulpis TaxID=2316076 RepID=UPI000EB48496|nr:hypothetical protein [Helicobacter vulpis]